jgi:hypothetical protein
MNSLNGFALGLGLNGGACDVACCCRRADTRSVISFEDEAGAVVWPTCAAASASRREATSWRRDSYSVIGAPGRLGVLPARGER